MSLKEVPRQFCYKICESYSFKICNGSSGFLNFNKGVDSIIITTCGFTTSMTFQSGFYYVFDSHSRDEKGMPISDGTFVLLKFFLLNCVETYLKNLYLNNPHNTVD